MLKLREWTLLTQALAGSFGVTMACSAISWLLWHWGQQNGLAFNDGLGDWQITVEGARARELTKLITIGILFSSLVFFTIAYSGFQRVYRQPKTGVSKLVIRLADVWWFTLKYVRMAWISVVVLISLACLFSVETSRSPSWF